VETRQPVRVVVVALVVVATLAPVASVALVVVVVTTAAAVVVVVVRKASPVPVARLQPVPPATASCNGFRLHRQYDRQRKVERNG
jgi:hypothetical protein